MRAFIGISALLAFAASVSAQCFNNCNIVYQQCQWNPVVDPWVCQQGMQQCVLNCVNSTSNWNNTYASNCTAIINNTCPFLDNNTCSIVVTQCMNAAFQPKINYWWSPNECTYQCNDASSLCNYTQYVDYGQCQNQTDQCYLNCFNYDYDNQWNNNSNNSNWTWFALESSAKKEHHHHQAKAKGVPCTACKWVAAKVERIIAKHGCNKAQISSACEAALGGAYDPLAGICSAAMVSACSYFTEKLNENEFTPQGACEHLHMCSASFEQF